MSPSATVGTPAQAKSPGFFQQVHSWLAAPFTTQGNALNWVLFVGLVLVAVWFWQVVLIDLTKEIKEV